MAQEIARSIIDHLATQAKVSGEKSPLSVATKQLRFRDIDDLSARCRRASKTCN